MAMPRSLTLVLLVPLLACADAPPPAVAKAPASQSAPSPEPPVVPAQSAPPPAPPAPPAAPVDAAAPASSAPLVRATKWVCDEQECEGRPVVAYDYLPAVTESGDLVAFVEERDGWGHTAKIGVHLVSGSREVAFLPTVTGDETLTLAAYQKKAKLHEGAITSANAALSKHPFRPLYPLAVAGEEVLVKGAWTKMADGITGKRRVTHAYANVRVVVTDPKDDEAQAGPRFESLVVEVDGKEVVTKKGTELPDQAGCSARRMVLDGVRAASKALALTFTNGATSHACDARREPQVHHVVRW
jgi:hypothetical protein